jgi:hypothetical protein
MNPFTKVNLPFRPIEAAKRAIGSKVELNGQTWHCVGHNDLGCLYWARSLNPNARQYYDSRLDSAAGFPAVNP